MGMLLQNIWFWDPATSQSLHLSKNLSSANQTRSWIAYISRDALVLLLDLGLELEISNSSMSTACQKQLQSFWGCLPFSRLHCLVLRSSGCWSQLNVCLCCLNLYWTGKVRTPSLSKLFVMKANTSKITPCWSSATKQVCKSNSQVSLLYASFDFVDGLTDTSEDCVFSSPCVMVFQGQWCKKFPLPILWNFIDCQVINYSFFSWQRQFFNQRRRWSWHSNAVCNVDTSSHVHFWAILLKTEASWLRSLVHTYASTKFSRVDVAGEVCQRNFNTRFCSWSR